MKKIIFIIIVMLIVTVALSYYLIKSKNELNEGIEKFEFNINFKLKDIDEILVSLLTEGGRSEYNIEDKETIAQIYNAVLNIKILSESNIRTSDDNRFYTFKLKDGTKRKIGFEGYNLIIDEKQYEVEGYSKLRSIKFE